MRIQLIQRNAPTHSIIKPTRQTLCGWWFKKRERCDSWQLPSWRVFQPSLLWGAGGLCDLFSTFFSADLLTVCWCTRPVLLRHWESSGRNLMGTRQGECRGDYGQRSPATSVFNERPQRAPFVSTALTAVRHLDRYAYGLGGVVRMWWGSSRMVSLRLSLCASRTLCQSDLQYSYRVLRPAAFHRSRTSRDCPRIRRALWLRRSDLELVAPLCTFLWFFF